MAATGDIRSVGNRRNAPLLVFRLAGFKPTVIIIRTAEKYLAFALNLKAIIAVAFIGSEDVAINANSVIEV